MSAPAVATAGRTQQELLRLVCALSGACRADRNVLKDAQLVDLLESQAKAILLKRRQQRKTALAADPPTISPQRSKLIKKLADANAESGKDGASKRRKLSFETDMLVKSPVKSSRAFEKPLLTGLDFAGEKNPATFAAHASSSVAVFNAALVDRMAQRAGSPQMFFKASASSSAFKSLDHGSVVDLSASMASTVTSTTPGFYDDMYDDMAADHRYRRSHSPGMESHGRRTPMSELTQSVDSIDWSPSDDEEDDELMESRSKPELATVIFNEEDENAAVDVPSAMVNSTEAVMKVLFDLLQQDRNYQWLVDPQNQSRVAKLVACHQRQQQQDEEEAEEAKSATSASEELRAQVEELVRENSRIQSENARLLEANQMSACDVEEQKQRVDELLQKLKASATLPVKKTVSVPRTDAEIRLAESEERLGAQEACRREAEAVFESELSAKTETVASLKKELESKDDEISALMQRVEAISAAFASKSSGRSSFDGSASRGLRRLSLSSQKAPLSESEELGDGDASMILHLREVNVTRENEVKRLRTVLMEKDREICNLYMHLSTKKKLVDEISSRLMQQVQTVAAERGADGETFSVEDLDLNLDMFLFKNVVEKQKTADELTAALGVMEREVESLEERVETLESENYTLKVTQEDLTSTLESANAEFMRVSAENELMEASLKEKQTRIRNLMLYLEEKEDQIVRLKDAAEQQLRPAFGSIASSYVTSSSFADDSRAY